MKILLISFGIYGYDGRLSELLCVSDEIGETTAVLLSADIKEHNKYRFVHINKTNYLTGRTYSKFLIECVKAVVHIKKPYVLFVDNFFASIAAQILMLIKKPQYIIQDVRELYYPEEVKSFFGKIFCKFELRLMKKADVVVCANDYRADIMLKKYKLVNRPIVFENVRFLNGTYDKISMDEKYRGLFKGRVNIVSTGGISVLRGTDRLVYAMIGLPDDFELYIIGGGSEEDVKEIKNIIISNELNKVKLLPKVPLEELRYILSQCDIGIVHYHKNDDNNKFCASGKIYEYLAEGLPIVTSENKPLVDFCLKNKIGIADDSFVQGITVVSKDINEYRNRVREYIKSISPIINNNECANQIIKHLSKSEEK